VELLRQRRLRTQPGLQLPDHLPWRHPRLSADAGAAGPYQLTSLADLFAFRYRSQLAGVMVTLFMLAGTLPYIALQIQAVTESIRVLTQE
jgi:hypothetical protein